MKSLKKIRNKHLEFLAQLKIDQMFYDERFKEFDEPKLRSDLSKLNNELEKETQKIQGVIAAQKRKNKGPVAEDLVEHTRIKNEINKINVVIAELEEYKTNKKKALRTIHDVKLMLNIIDNLSKKEINNL